MSVFIWTIVGLTTPFIICCIIIYCYMKSYNRTATLEHFKNDPSQTPVLMTYKDKIIQSLFDGDVEKFFKYKSVTFWYYKDSKYYFETRRFNVDNVKNKIARYYDKLRQKHPGITDFFVSIIENNNRLNWEYDPIDLNSYDPPKSAKNICIDELNKLIENK